MTNSSRTGPRGSARSSASASARSTSDPAQVGGVVVVDVDPAGGAPPLRLDRRAAGPVLEGHAPLGGRSGVGLLGAPLGEEAEGVGEGGALAGEAVGEADRSARVGLGDDEALLLEGAQPLGEDVGGDAGDRLLELAEA